MTYPVGAVERAMKVQEVILRALSGQLTWLQAADDRPRPPDEETEVGGTKSFRFFGRGARARPGPAGVGARSQGSRLRSARANRRVARSRELALPERCRRASRPDARSDRATPSDVPRAERYSAPRSRGAPRRPLRRSTVMPLSSGTGARVCMILSVTLR